MITTSNPESQAVPSRSALDHSLLRALLETGAALNSTLDLEHLLEIIVDAACRIFNCSASSVLLIDEDTNSLFFKTASGEKREEIKRIRLSMGEGIAGWVAQNGKPMLVNDVAQEPRFAREVSENLDYTTRSIIAVPLLVSDKTIGVMEVLNRIDGPFAAEDVEALMLLARQVSGALEGAKLFGETDRERERLRTWVEDRYVGVGESPAFREIVKLVHKVARTKSTILLRGESGTGKEVIARMIHRESLRSHRPLISVNCAAITDTLLESELFGYDRGAFTGADRLKKGKFELADGGTVFLDEIGSMGVNLQSKLLRVLQERTIDRVGGTRPIPIDVRIIAATNCDLEKQIEEGRFREDLFYRLNVIAITLPPLRERKQDVALLADFFVKRYNRETNKNIRGISQRALEVLMDYDFPGNIRELENVVERAVVLEDEELIQPERLPIREPSGRASFSLTGLGAHPTLDQVEEAYIRKVLNDCRFKKTESCRVLGISRPTLDRKLERYAIEIPRD